MSGGVSTETFRGRDGRAVRETELVEVPAAPVTSSVSIQAGLDFLAQQAVDGLRGGPAVEQESRFAAEAVDLLRLMPESPAR